MRSRRDQLQAYQFLRRRTIAALLSGDPDSPEAPMRRIVRTAFAGVMIAVLIGATFSLVGLIRKGGATSWQKADTIIFDKDSAAVYVWVSDTKGAPRRLHPMVNLTSARLFLGSATSKPKSLSSKSLAGIPRAPLKGIREAPGSVPAPKELIRGPWTVCARTQDGVPEVTLLVGVPLADAPLGPAAGLLVTAGRGQDSFVVWKGMRFKIPQPKVLSALGFSVVEPRVVGAAWVNALPPGRDLTFPVIPDRGKPSLVVDGKPTAVGQVFQVTNLGKVRYAVALGQGIGAPRGLAPISEGVAGLLLADPQGLTKAPRVLTPAAFSDVEMVAAPASLAGYPDQALKQVTGPERGVFCTSASGAAAAGSPLTVHAVNTLPGGTQVVDLSGRASGGRALADQAYLRAGGAALVRGDGTNKTRYLITDVGTRFPIPDEALSALGYQEARVAIVPAQFLELLPDGPSLSREEAAKPVR